MAPFNFTQLPNDVAIAIIKRVERQDGYRALCQLSVTGKEMERVAKNDEVLVDLSLVEFLNNLDLAKIQSPQRKFFNRCVRAKNPVACYIEGLIFAGNGQVNEGIRVLTTTDPENLCCKFAKAVFLYTICRNNRGVTILNTIYENRNVKEMLAREFLQYLGELRTNREYVLHDKNDGFNDKKPSCAFKPCKPWSSCINCFLYFTALDARMMC